MAKATVTDEAAAFVFGGDPANESATSTDKTTAKITKKNTVKNKSKSKAKLTDVDVDKSAAAAVLFGNMATVRKAKPERYTIDLDPDLAEQFTRVAKLTGQTKSKLLRQIMKTAFDAIESQNQG